MFHVEHYRVTALCLALGLLLTLGFAAAYRPLLAAPALQTPPPAGCEELVRNGSFETLGSSAWAVVNDPRLPIYVDDPTFEGDYALQLGIVDLGNAVSSSRVQQTLTIPDWADSVSLRFRYFPLYDNSPGASDLQYGYVFNEFSDQIVDTPLRVVRNDRDWLFVERNLTEQTGQQIRLVFAVDNDGENGRVGMFLDSVSVLACRLDQPAPVVTPTLTPTATFTPSTTPIPTTPPTVEPSATPIVATAIPPTPTPNVVIPPTATLPPAAGCRNDLQDGGFETDAGWIFGRDPIPPRYVSDPLGGGSRVVLLGNPPNSGNPNVVTYSSVRRLVTIPSDASSAVVSWRALYQTQEGVDAQPNRFVDRQDFVLLSPGLDTVAVPFRTRSNTAGYQATSIDLSGYRGHTLYLYFNAFNDGDGARTWMYLDDVALEVCGGAGSAVQSVPAAAAPAVAAPAVVLTTPVAPLIEPDSVVIISATQTAEAVLALPLAAPSATPTLEFPSLPTVDPAAPQPGVLEGSAANEVSILAGQAPVSESVAVTPGTRAITAPFTLPLDISVATDLDAGAGTATPELDSFVPVRDNDVDGSTGGGFGGGFGGVSGLVGGFSGLPWAPIAILVGVLAIIFIVVSFVQRVVSRS